MLNPELLRLTRMHREGSYNTQPQPQGSRQADRPTTGRGRVQEAQGRQPETEARHGAGGALEAGPHQPGDVQEPDGGPAVDVRQGRQAFSDPRARNAALGIPDRQYVTNESKARELTPAFGDIDMIKSPHVRMSLELQRAFGLRPEEALKIRPAWAERGTKLVLQGSWTKGGRPREIRILTQHQREVLDQAKALAGNGSLIPREKNYINHLRTYKRQVAAGRFPQAARAAACLRARAVQGTDGA